MKWIYAEDDWHDLRAYHTARGSVRTWIDAAAIWAAARWTSARATSC